MRIRFSWARRPKDWRRERKEGRKERGRGGRARWFVFSLGYKDRWRAGTGDHATDRVRNTGSSLQVKFEVFVLLRGPLSYVLQVKESVHVRAKIGGIPIPRATSAMNDFVGGATFRPPSILSSPSLSVLLPSTSFLLARNHPSASILSPPQVLCSAAVPLPPLIPG